MSTRLTVSFARGNQALGHASRLVAVHAALRERGWDSLFFTDQAHRLLADYGFEQIIAVAAAGTPRPAAEPPERSRSRRT